MKINNMRYSERVIYDSLLELQGLPNVTTTQICQHSGAKKTSAVRAVERLEKFGLITRTGGGRRWGYTYSVKPAA